MATVADLCTAPQEVVVLQSTSTVLDGFKTLIEHQISSCPVYDEKHHTYIGMFDTSDFAAYVTQVVEHQDSCPTDFCDLGDLLLTMGRLCPKTMESVVNLAGNNPFVPVHLHDPLTKVLELLGLRGLHRVPVLDDKGKVVKILTQSSVAAFLQKHAWEPLHSLEHETIENTSLGLKHVVTIREDHAALEALKLMQKNSISGIGVTDPHGRLITSLSNTDLRVVVSGSKFRFSGISVLEFVQKSRSLDGPREKPAVVTCSVHTTLPTLLAKMVQAHLHRIYITNDDQHVIGIVSLKDLLRYVLQKSTD